MKYEEYKDSGVEWIGGIPDNWEKQRIKFLCSNSSAGIWGEEEKGDTNDIACFRIADFDYQIGYLRFDKLTIRNIQSKDLCGRVLDVNSLLIEKSGGGEATPVGRVVRYNFEDKATCSNFIHFITINDSYSRDFLYYYFYALYANKENLLYFNQTTGIQNLKIGEYLGQSIFLPKLPEQQAIATYLDEKCGEINRAIDVQNKKIELLRELKQTIITDAVTKGLTPNAPMKDSGVEWIGKVPEHWEVVPLKRNLSKGQDNLKVGPFGSQLKGDEILEDGDFWVYNQRTVIDNNFKTTNSYIAASKYKDLQGFAVKGDDVLITTRGTIGRVAQVPHKYNKGIIHPCLIKFRIDNSKLIYPFLAYLFNESGIVKQQIMLNSNATTIDVIYGGTLKEIILPIPSIKEQKNIVKRLDEECTKIDSQISNANHRIELLNELKQSIITEAVTGKIKVC